MGRGRLPSTKIGSFFFVRAPILERFLPIKSHSRRITRAAHPPVWAVHPAQTMSVAIRAEGVKGRSRLFVEPCRTPSGFQIRAIFVTQDALRDPGLDCVTLTALVRHCVKVPGINGVRDCLCSGTFERNCRTGLSPAPSLWDRCWDRRGPRGPFRRKSIKIMLISRLFPAFTRRCDC